MSVEYYTCAYCQETFPDCGWFFSCDCGFHFCDDACGIKKLVGEPDPNLEDIFTCRYCRKDDATSHQLLMVLLKHFNLTIEQAMEIYRKNG